MVGRRREAKGLVGLGHVGGCGGRRREGGRGGRGLGNGGGDAAVGGTLEGQADGTVAPRAVLPMSDDLTRRRAVSN